MVKFRAWYASLPFCFSEAASDLRSYSLEISTGEKPMAEPKGRKGAYLRLCRAPGSVPASVIGLVPQ